MKRVIAIILTGLLTIGVYSVGCTKESEVEEPPIEIIETEPIKYLTDYQLSLLYSLKSEIKKPDVIDLTQDEAWLLMKIAVAEAGYDDYVGQSYIMQTVQNRIESDEFPDTVGEVIFQSKQFSSVKDGRLEESEPDLDSHYALYLFETQQVKCDALFFEADWVEDSWQSKHKTKLFTHNGTVYYK